MMARRDGHKGREDGFTLVEVLAALAIFSIAALGLMRATGEGARVARIVEGRAMAAILAQNVLANTLLEDDRLEIGVSGERMEFAGREWEVETTVSETPNPLLLELRIDAKSADGRAGNAQLTTFRPANP